MKGGRRILFLILVVSILGIVVFFTYPIKINTMLQEKQRIGKVHATCLTNRETLRYVISKDNVLNFDELISILNSVSYNREIRKFEGAAGNAVITMNIAYKDEKDDPKLYFVYLHDSGIIRIDNKEYQINGDSKAMVKKLHNWIRENGTLVPSEGKVDLFEDL